MVRIIRHLNEYLALADLTPREVFELESLIKRLIIKHGKSYGIRDQKSD